MAANLIDRFMQLPLRESEVWQGGLVPIANPRAGQTGSPQRLEMPMWVDPGSGRTHAGEFLASGSRDFDAVLRVLLEFALDPELAGYRPGRVEVADAQLALYLRNLLADSEVQVEHDPALAETWEGLAEMTEHMAGPDAPPALLDAPGVTADAARAFAEAAKEFYEARVWDHLCGEDLVHIESRVPEPEMEFFSVLGSSGENYGLGFYRSRRDFEVVAGGVDAADYFAGRRAWTMLYDAAFYLPMKDFDLWQTYELPVAGEEAYPFPARHDPGDRIHRPDARTLAFLEGLLRALTATTEEEMDSGRWTKTVQTHGGTMQMKLSLPYLLEPAKQKGIPLDIPQSSRRILERVLSKIQRRIEETPEGAMDETDKWLAGTLEAAGHGRRPKAGQTPLEQARDLVDEAYDSVGRRRIQLARKALQISPDCAEAYVLLAHSAGDPQKAHDLFAQGMAAAERVLGPEYFEQNAGDFWGLLETRPYMQARAGLAATLKELGRIDEAIGHYKELLRLNPVDNQANRYELIGMLLQHGRDDEAERLWAQYEEEGSSLWAHARALLTFRRDGDSERARQHLREAQRRNRFTSEYLSGRRQLPPVLPDLYKPGSAEEAMLDTFYLLDGWKATPGAVRWLDANQPPRATKARRPNASARQKEDIRKKRKKRK